MFKKTLMACSLSFVLSTFPQSSKVTLTWDPHCDTNVVQFVVYYGTNPLSNPIIKIKPSYTNECGTNVPPSTNVYKGSYTSGAFVPSFTNSITFTNLTPLTKYYFVVAARNSAGLESEYSNEIEYETTNSIPSKVLGLRVLEIK